MANKNVIQYLVKLQDKASAALKGIGSAAGEAGTKVDGVNEGLKGTKKSSDDAASSLPKASQSFGEVAGKAVMAATAAMAAAKAFKAMTQGLADSRNELADTATKTGLNVSTLASLRLAAEGSGLQLGKLSRGLQQLPKRMADTARGTGEALIAFEALGVSAVDSDGNLRGADETLRELLTKLNEVEDPTTRASLATQAFGGSGAFLMQALSGAELEQFSALANHYGVSLAPKAMKASADWQREVAGLSLVFDGLKDSLMSAMTGTDGATGLLSDVTAGFVFLGSVAGRIAEMIATTWSNALIPIRAAIAALSGDMFGAQKMMEEFRPKLMFGFVPLFELDGAIDEATESMEQFRQAMEATKNAAVALPGGRGGTPPEAVVPEAGQVGETGVDDSAAKEAAARMKAFMKSIEKLSNAGAKAAKSTMKQEKESVKMQHALDGMSGDFQAAALQSIDLGDEAMVAFVGIKDDFEASMQAMEAAIPKQKLQEAGQAMGAGLGVGTDIMSTGGMGTLAGAGAVGAGAAGLIGMGQMGKDAYDQEIEQRAQQAASERQAALQEQRDAAQAQGFSEAELEAQGLGQEDIQQAGEVTAADTKEAEAGLDQNEFIAEQVQAVVQGVIDGILAIAQALPDILSALIPMLLIQLPKAIIEMIPTLIEKLIPVLVGQLPVALIKSILINVPKMIGMLITQLIPGIVIGVGRALSQFWRGIVNMLRDFFSFGSKQTGGFVPKTANYLLHQGERVVPSTGAGSGTASKGLSAFNTSGPSLTVNTNVVSPDAIPELSRLIDREMGAGGRAAVDLWGEKDLMRTI